MRTARSFLVILMILGPSSVTEGQDTDGLKIEVKPSSLTLEVGEQATLVATVLAADGTIKQDVNVIFYSRARRSLSVTREGHVQAHRAGEFTLVALIPRDSQDTNRQPAASVLVEIPVTVPQPRIETVTFVNMPKRFFVGTRFQLRFEAIDELEVIRQDVVVSYNSNDMSIAEVDRYGFITLRRAGSVELSVHAGEIVDKLTVEVEPNPVTTFELIPETETARTGDVVSLKAIAKDSQSLNVNNVPVQFGVFGTQAEKIIASGAAAMVTHDGFFVAERSGTYTVVATIGTHTATATISVEQRGVQRDIELVGRGQVVDRHTSDLWIWEGADGRDYAITGTWGSDGRSYVWDVTEPSSIEKLHEIRVDARTVNDVKVSENGEVAVISREGASDRQNGIVLLGVENPREGVPILSQFTDQLTGGVHNVFISGDYVFALSASRRYDVINIKDPRNPQRVGKFELETPGHGIHDVWVKDGVAFSSNWADGIVAVDVGGGGRGGTPEKPIELGRYAYPNGWNHAAFPYKSKSTGKFYVFAGDESFPFGGLTRGQGTVPTRAAGWIHIIDWSDWDNPREVARYQVPEAGSHNLWVEEDVLYVAYYNGGLRVVDVSGELMGDLYRQGREIGMFMPYDPEGFIANAPFVWGPQPYKGNIFFTDWNSGLWVVRLGARRESNRIVGEPQ